MKAALHGEKAAASMLGWTETSSERFEELLSEVDALFGDDSTAAAESTEE